MASHGNDQEDAYAWTLAWLNATAQKALVVYNTGEKSAPEEPPPLQAAIRILGRVGGFLGRKSDGEPGAETLWRRLQMLSGMAGLWRVMTSP